MTLRGRRRLSRSSAFAFAFARGPARVVQVVVGSRGCRQCIIQFVASAFLQIQFIFCQFETLFCAFARWLFSRLPDRLPRKFDSILCVRYSRHSTSQSSDACFGFQDLLVVRFVVLRIVFILLCGMIVAGVSRSG